MSALADLLLAKEPLFDMALVQLEERTGRKGADAALTAELATKSAVAQKALGLSPDCTGPELYVALLKHVERQDAHLARSIGVHDVTNVQQVILLVLQRLDKVNMPRDCYALKHDVAAKMLAKQPPKALMERLGYTDIAAMLEGENLAELFIAIRFTEGPDWLNQFNEVYRDLTRGDFESRPIEVVHFDRAKWGDVADHFIVKKKHINTHSKEMGVVAILPPPHTHMSAITMKVMTLTLHYYNEVRLYSSFFKLMSHKKNFGEIIVDTLIADPAHVDIAGKHIHWRVIQRYFGKLGAAEEHPEILEPHLQPEDLHWRAAEDIMYAIDPELEFWRELDYVAIMKDGDPVTFNLMDNVLGYANNIGYDERYLYHFREALWNEVFARYMGHSVLRHELLDKLDNAVDMPEKLVPSND